MLNRVAATLVALCCAASSALAATEIKLVNAGFEEPANGARAPGWFGTQHYGATRDYEWAVDTTTASEGKGNG